MGIEINNLPGNNLEEKTENFNALASLGKYAQLYYEKLIEVCIALTHQRIDSPLSIEQLIKIAEE